jgi:hypothetical protein
MIRVDRLADSCIVIAVMPWVEAPAYGAAIGRINEAILEVFRERPNAIFSMLRVAPRGACGIRHATAHIAAASKLLEADGAWVG